MSTKIYILTLEGEPQYATTRLSDIEKECHDWFDRRYNNWSIQRDYSYWLEDRNYPNTDDGEERAWNDYVEEQFENGTWGDYAWYECYLK